MVIMVVVAVVDTVVSTSTSASRWLDATLMNAIWTTCLKVIKK